MNIIETIRTEIERLYDGEAPKHDQQCDFDDGYFTGIDAISKFLDTLQEQKPKQEQDLPKWKIADKPIFGAMYIVRKVYGALVEHTVAQYVCEGEEYIIVRELEKLQKEK